MKPSNQAPKSPLPDRQATPASRPRGVKLGESFQVVVECVSEADQEAVYEQLKRAGRRCRLLTM